MLRRSLIVILAVALLALAFTAGYALLPVRSPADLLQDASSLIAKGDHLAAAELLDRSESSPAFAQSTDLRRQLWRLRLQAHRSLDISTRALQDIDSLIADGDQGVGLQMERVYHLAKSGRGDEARTAGIALASANPKNARAQELAGEACKVAYTPALRATASRVRADVGYEREQPAVAALLEFLYRPEGDPSVAAAGKRLRDYYLSESRLAQAWPQLQDELARLRGSIQEASDHFLRALETAGQDPAQRTSFFAAAFQGVAYALQQGGRNDDLDAQSEIYFGSYTHRWRTDAAAAAAAARYRDGLYAAAIDVAERCAPVESFPADFAANRFSPAIRSLITTRCLAHYKLGQKDELIRFTMGIQDALKTSPALHVLTGLAWGLAHTLANNQEHRTGPLQWYADVTLRDPAPQDGEDPLDLVMPLLLESLASDGKPTDAILSRLDAWTTARPGNPLPLRSQARWQIKLGQDAAAMATAAAILQERPTDEPALHLLAEAADLAYKGSRQDGASLLIHCLQRNTDRPDSPPHTICYVLCAEAALKQQHAWIAKACARLAADHYPWSSWPTLLLARAEAMLGNTAGAIESLERLLARDGDDAEAIRLCFQLKNQEGLTVRSLLAKAVAVSPGSAQTITALLRTAVEDHGPAMLPLARKALVTDGAGAELLALAANAFAIANDPVAARNALQRARAAGDHAAPRNSRDLLGAELACLVAEGRDSDDDQLALSAERLVTASPCSGPDAAHQYAAAARTLAASRRHKAASRLLSAALAAGDAIEVRDGRTHSLAGDLALALARTQEARACYTAAISFEDGAEAAERLARLELLDSAPHRAVACLATVAAPADAALLCLLGSGDAAKVARERVAKSPDDLLAIVPFLLLAGSNDDPFATELRAATPAAQREALLACSLLGDPMLAPSAVEHAAAAASQAPRCFLVALLHARAMLATGDVDGAASLHARLYDEGRRSTLLWTEVARSALQGGYRPPRSILSELETTARKAPTSLGAETLAMLALQAASEADRLGQPDVALGIRADVWRLYPTASRASAVDAETLRAAGRSVAAVELLYALTTATDGPNRDALASSLYDTALPVTDALAPASKATLRLLAESDLVAGRAQGPAFRFLCADAQAMQNMPNETAMRLARIALLAACVGKAPWDVASQALELMRDRAGAAGAAAVVDEALSLHPAAPRLWTARASLRFQVAEQDTGIDAARALAICIDDAEFQIEVITLAAKLRKSTPADQAAFDALPKAAQDGQSGRLAQALLALRNGQPERAEAAFAACATKSDWSLYARALANLMRRDPKARDQARASFEELRTTYPSSSLARNVGSFSLQLGPN